MKATSDQHRRGMHSSVIGGRAVDYEIFGEAPVQALGTIGGHEFYFRARHDTSEFEVESSTDSMLSEERTEPGFRREGKVANASFMSQERAVALIDSCVIQFLAPHWHGIAE